MAVLRIEGEMTIYQAVELKDDLLKKIQESDTLEIDLSAVTECDTAGVQLLMWAKKLSQSEGKKLHLGGHSAAVLDVFNLLDLAGYFGDPLILHRI